MLKIGRMPFFIFLGSIALFYGWNFFMTGNEPLRFMGNTAFHILIGGLSFFWLFTAYRNTAGKSRAFWLLMSLGMLTYLVSNSAWLYLQVIGESLLFTNASYMIWLLSSLFFLSALILKTRDMSASFPNREYLFNIIIFMIAAGAISFQYLIWPALLLPGDSLLMTAVAVAYPLKDLGILFVITVMYYLNQYNEEKGLLLFIVIGFFLQIAADSWYTYLSFTDSYQVGHTIDLLWLCALLLIGMAGFNVRKNQKEPKWKIRNLFEKREVIFPYASILILTVLVIVSYNWNFNALSTGLLIAFLMVIGRQLIVINKNNKLMSEYKYLAHHDPLTGLDNRASFKERLDQAILHAKGGKAAVLLIDLDRFKMINDTLGHHAGDHILIKAAERLKCSMEQLEPDSLIFRLGGDEFVIIIPEATSEKCTSVAEEILRNFKRPFQVSDHEISVTPSIGISLYPENGTSKEDLLKNADAAMYLSKETGSNRFTFYNSELHAVMVRRMMIENGLRKAIEQDELSIFYQPKVDLHTKRLIGMEALLRWKHPELGPVSPGEFIPIAEETGQIVPIGAWVLKNACRQNRKWQDQGFPALRVSVNVSVRQFQRGEFLQTVREALHESKLAPQFLELEITESIMQNLKESMEILTVLRQAGVRISIDDFGTGYSSLHLLEELPIDTIKIDKSFVDRLEDQDKQSMVKSIIELGRNFGLNIIAEGIESEIQRDSLIRHDCRFGQGYLFSKPISPDDFESFMRSAAQETREAVKPMSGES